MKYEKNACFFVKYSSIIDFAVRLYRSVLVGAFLDESKRQSIVSLFADPKIVYTLDLLWF